MIRRFSLPIVFVCAMIALACASCAPGVDSRGHEKVASAPAPKLQAVNLDDPIHPEPHDQPIVLDAAKNEWVTFAIQLSDIRAGTTGRIKINSADLPASSFQISQILSMPVDVNRAGYVRHTGLTVSEQPLPRALLPITMKSGAVDFSGLRDPRQPTSATNRFQGGFDPVLLWIDVRIPTDAKPGE